MHNFLRISGKVNAVISKVFGVVNYESEVKILKLEMADPIWRLRIQYFSKILDSFAILTRKLQGFLGFLTMILKLDIKN